MTKKIDKTKIERAIIDIFSAIGQDLCTPSLKDTPKRVANMYEEIFSGINSNPKDLITFFDEDFKEDIVIAKDISFFSMCEHHMIPFFGKVHICYMPSEGKLLGFSKLARLVEVFTKRPQIQERITSLLADFLANEVCARGVAVIIEAEHMCMTMRGAKQVGSQIITTAFRGIIATDTALKTQALHLLK